MLDWSSAPTTGCVLVRMMLTSHTPLTPSAFCDRPVLLSAIADCFGLLPVTRLVVTTLMLLAFPTLMLLRPLLIARGNVADDAAVREETLADREAPVVCEIASRRPHNRR